MKKKKQERFEVPSSEYLLQSNHDTEQNSAILFALQLYIFSWFFKCPYILHKDPLLKFIWLSDPLLPPDAHRQT